MSFTVGSLFDGSGGFPLAAFMCGGVPVWASEVEPYPIAVTRSRFPYMEHLGSVTRVKGNTVKPVDVITFGSPCQDLSVAGKRAGLKHEDNGDDETTRSGLFMEAVRVIKEMREATNGEYPKFVLWENVPGAYTSSKGEDFRVVLEELIKIVEPTAVMPEVPKAGWAYADIYLGEGWSLAYRTLDAQYWGVPQRRRRIYLVLDLTGERAGEILFEREGLRGYFETGRTPWQDIAGDASDCSGATDCGSGVAYGWPLGFRPENTKVYEEVATTICNGTRPGFTCGVIETLPFDTTQVTSPMNYSNPKWGDPCHPLAAGQHPPAVIYKADDGSTSDVSPTLVGDHNNRVTDHTALVVEPMVCLEGNGQRPSHRGDGWAETDKMYTLNTIDRHAVAYAMQGFGDYKDCGVASGLKQRDYKDATDLVVEENPIVLDRAFYNQGQNAQYEPQLYDDGTCPTLVAKGPGAVCVKYVVRRLTPTECARLQGFPDEWGHPDQKDDFTDEEYRFWLGVRNEHAEINGKTVKDYTKAQMLTWYNKLHTDSSEYKMWGNGIALPCALYVMQGIADCV